MLYTDELLTSWNINDMTRINLVDPSMLINKHLMAEYRELPRIFTSVKKLTKLSPKIRPCDIEGIPPQYVLGKGHMKFFYDKLAWLYNRYHKIRKELLERGYELDHNLFESVCEQYLTLPISFRNNYEASPEEIYLNMCRICKRSGIPKVMLELELDSSR